MRLKTLLYSIMVRYDAIDALIFPCFAPTLICVHRAKMRLHHSDYEGGSI